MLLQRIKLLFHKSIPQFRPHELNLFLVPALMPLAHPPTVSLLLYHA